MEGLSLILNKLEISLEDIVKTELSKSGLIKNQSKQTLYHYTSLEGLQKIIINKALYFSNSAFLNDKKEFVLGSESFEEIINQIIENKTTSDREATLKKILTKIKGSNNSDRFVACFSLAGDLLSQWRAYANDGKGVCIGFDLNKLSKSFKGVESFSIIYKDENQKKIATEVLNIALNFYIENRNILFKDLTKEEFENIISSEIYNQVAKYIGQFKHDAFNEEKEFRFEIRIDNDIDNKREISYRCGRNNLFVPYINETIINELDLFPIKEIIIGPSLNSELNKLSISGFLSKNKYNLNDIDVRESRVPYRI